MNKRGANHGLWASQNNPGNVCFLKGSAPEKVYTSSLGVTIKVLSARKYPDV